MRLQQLQGRNKAMLKYKGEAASNVFLFGSLRVQCGSEGGLAQQGGGLFQGMWATSQQPPQKPDMFGLDARLWARTCSLWVVRCSELCCLLR